MVRDFFQYAQKTQPTEFALKLQDKLTEYCSLAKEMGAADAKIISSAEVILDPKVRVKCQYSLCRFYKSCANCPPQSARVDETKELLKLYNYGIFMMFKCPADRNAMDSQFQNSLSQNSPSENSQSQHTQTRHSISTVISAVESAAFCDGYYFAVGYGSGPCKHTFCSENKSCAALQGNGCRTALFARTSMESVGMDVVSMVTSQGWKLGPIDMSSSSANVPERRQVGLVLVV